MKLPIPKGDIGVIVGRFQVHQLHQGHRTLISDVLNRHTRVIIFLGVSVAAPTKRNPLDFASRKAMIEMEYPDIIVLPIVDQNNDKVWSHELDKKIREVFPIGKPILYGNRDSFIKSYSGMFDTVEYEPEVYVSGTEVRKEISNIIGKDVNFRQGVIYGVGNRFPVCYPTIDVVCFDRSNEHILLARKPNGDKYCFIGGFVDPTDESFENSAIREFREETGGKIGELTYIGSFKIDDWRYHNTEDGIMTILFSTVLMAGPIQPRDDIEELRWFPIHKIQRNLISSAHQPLMDAIVKKFGFDYYNPIDNVESGE